MKTPAIFSGIPFSYVVAAVIFGIVMAFGIGAMTYHPLPVQVQINQYAPIKVPAPSELTLAPQYVPGSAASKPTPANDPYAPAQAPVVVTTQPLPTITPEPVGTVWECDVTATDPATMMTCVMPQFANVVVGVVPIVFIVAILGLVFEMLGSVMIALDDALGLSPRNRR
jgi:hypothetical protein